jgi:hypothetical protein
MRLPPLKSFDEAPSGAWPEQSKVHRPTRVPGEKMDEEEESVADVDPVTGLMAEAGSFVRGS